MASSSASALAIGEARARTQRHLEALVGRLQPQAVAERILSEFDGVSTSERLVLTAWRAGMSPCEIAAELDALEEATLAAV